MEEFLWVEKYRPHTVDETIMPVRMKSIFKGFVEQGDIPNCILTGSTGVGKTTIAKAVVDELGSTIFEVNGSLELNKDALRNDITSFATSMSIDGKRKYVLIDEADGIPPATQGAFRNFMEAYSKNCGFILTCNMPHKIIEAIHSRCPTIEFKYGRDEKKDMMKQIMVRMFNILENENVEYDKKVVAMFIDKHYPDVRKMIGFLQKHGSNGTIDSSLLTDFEESSLNQLLTAMRKKNFDAMRKWVAESDIDQHDVYVKLYDIAKSHFTASSVPQLVVLLGEYQYKAAFSINPDINLMAALLEISATLEWKD